MGMGKIKALKIRSIGFFAPDFLHVAFLGFSAKKRLRQKLKVMSEILSVPASRNNFAKKDRIDYSCGGAACFWCCVICPEDADLAFIPAEVRLAITIKSMMMDTIIRISWTEQHLILRMSFASIEFFSSGLCNFVAQIIYFCKNNNKIRIPMKENVIKLHDKKFKVMIPAAKIEEAVAAVAAKINEDYQEKRNPLFLGVLNGSFMFMSDLLKKIDFNCEISFVKLSSYCGTSSSGDVKCLIGLGNNIEGRDVIIVEDIVDTGASIEHMVEELKTKKPASIRVCTLFFKPKAYQRQIPIDYPAMHIGNEFIVGYGLDYDQLGRNYKDVYVVTE